MNMAEWKKKTKQNQRPYAAFDNELAENADPVTFWFLWL